MRSKRPAILLALVGLTATACGAGSDGSESVSDTAATPITDTAPTDTEAPAAASAGADESEAPPEAQAATDDASPATDESNDAPPADDTSADEPVSEEAAPEEPVASEPEPAPIGGRAFAATLEPASDFEGNPFPDLVVDDVRRGDKVNIRNIFPAERPVVLWGWAPH